MSEFVAVNKDRLPTAKLSLYLEEAVTLLRQKEEEVFDSNRFEVYAVTAKQFANIGNNARANEVFAETLSALDREIIENGSDSSLLFAMCNIGVEFEQSRIKPSEQVREALRRIIKNWEVEAYQALMTSTK